MSSASEIAHRHFDAALAEALEQGTAADAVARALLYRVLATYQETRSVDDIRSELEFAAESLDDDREYAFMRPSG